MFADSNSVLADYEYVQQCLKLDHDIKFVIVDVDSVKKPFRRTVTDRMKQIICFHLSNSLPCST